MRGTLFSSLPQAIRRHRSRDTKLRLSGESSSSSYANFQPLLGISVGLPDRMEGSVESPVRMVRIPRTRCLLGGWHRRISSCQIQIAASTRSHFFPDELPLRISIFGSVVVEQSFPWIIAFFIFPLQALRFDLRSINTMLSYKARAASISESREGRIQRVTEPSLLRSLASVRETCCGPAPRLSVFCINHHVLVIR